VTGILRVEGFNGDCSVEQAIPITVLPSPVVLFSFSEDTLCTSGAGATWITSPAGGVFSGDGVVNNWFVLSAAEFGLNTVTYSYTNSFNCTSSATDEIVLETCIDVNEGIRSQVDPYPNPFVNHFMLDAANGSSQFEVYNALGSVVCEGIIHQRTFIDTTEWKSGTYFVRLYQAGTTKTHRIVKIDG
jgi:hypothetical protein